MRISHLQALADIVLGDFAAPVDDGEAVFLKAVGIATDAARFQAAYAKLQQSALNAL